MQAGKRCVSARDVLVGLVLAVAVNACAPVEPFGDASGKDNDQVRDGREAAEDAARRIAAAGAGVARQIGEVARNLQPIPERTEGGDDAVTTLPENRE